MVIFSPLAARFRKERGVSPKESLQKLSLIHIYWTPYEAHTVDNLKGFKKKKEPALSVFGGYKTNRQEATGFFRTEKINGRWWIIDPEGYPFHHRAVVALSLIHI